MPDQPAASSPSAPLSPRAQDTDPLDRRSFLAWTSSLGLAGTLFPGVLWARMEGQEAITSQMLAEAAKVAGLEFTEEEREMMVASVDRHRDAMLALREVKISNSVPPAIHFEPQLPRTPLPVGESRCVPSRRADIRRPERLEEVAFWPVTHLAELIRTRQVTPSELTGMYLERLKRHGPTLECVVTLTEELAWRQARRADDEIAAGNYRGPLHGIPWGAKDLLAVQGYPTTWGAPPYQNQVIDDDATVVTRLEQAGAILVAKLTLGSLAQGDVWFGGMTRNPWNLEQGSSGSSAGPAAATVAGLVGFGIGSETLGSIVSPATRCGATGLRPSFGRVSRAGAMALSWSMDKLGPLCRSVEDCALVLHAIQGADGRDSTARDVGFDWRGDGGGTTGTGAFGAMAGATGLGVQGLRVGYLQSAFEREREGPDFDTPVLEVLRREGVELIPVELPDALPTGALSIILSAEAGAAFDDLTRSGRDSLLVRQGPGAWPNTFRSSRMIPAVEYIQANRVRTLIMEALDDALSQIDVLVTPSYAPNLLLMTNLTGHPTVVLPNGFTDEGTPVSISFVGGLWKDAEAMRVARLYQEATDFHRSRPEGFV
ncbi:MAG: amidase [Gemmatimonadota bacterium]